MTNEQIKEIGKRLANKSAIIKFTKEDYKGNLRKNPIYSERTGMHQMLNVLGIEFEYEIDKEYNETAVTVAGYRFEID